MLKSLRKDKKKGFTLVELIVVLVILAILAALLIPALTGYIDKAREKQIVAETRQIVMAAQTLLDEEYGKTVPTGSTSGDIEFVDTASAPGAYGEIEIAEVAELSEVALKWSSNAVVIASDDGTVKIEVGNKTAGNAGNSVEIGTIAKVTYKAHGVLCTYDKNTGDYVITKK